MPNRRTGQGDKITWAPSPPHQLWYSIAVSLIRGPVWRVSHGPWKLALQDAICRPLFRDPWPGELKLFSVFQVLKDHGQNFLVGNMLSKADIQLLEVILMVEEVKTDSLSKFSLLKVSNLPLWGQTKGCLRQQLLHGFHWLPCALQA